MSPRLIEAGHKAPTSCIGILADLWSKDGVTQKELGMSLIKTKSSINKMLSSLESDGLVYKADHPTDKRNKLIYLTEPGKAMKTTIQQADQISEKELLAGVDPKDIETAKKVLTILYENLTKKIEDNAKIN